MTWNPENTPDTILDTISGNVTEWYNAVDDVLRKSEVIPGNYEYSINTSYSSDGTFQEGGQTNIDIVCDRFKIVSLENSYIHLTQNFTITAPDQQTSAKVNSRYYYIGFKSAFDVIDQFRIYSNSDLIQTQNYNNIESFVQYMAISDEAKKNSELYATFEKVQAKQTDVPGVYINIAQVAEAKSITVPITTRIPLSSFLLLANLKWFPGFFGKMRIEIYPSYKNLVVCPIYESAEDVAVTGLDTKVADLVTTANGPNICGFHQINEVCAKTVNATNAATAACTTLTIDQTFACSTSECTKCHIRLAQYMVKMDVYQELQSKYLQVPMLFPTQQIISMDFSGKLTTGSGSTFTCAQTSSLNHCNSMFIVFPKTQHSRTVFENPEITYQVNIDGKFFPREAYATHNDKRNVNLFLDATNFNGDSLFSIPDDVYHSIEPYHNLYTYAAGGALTTSRYYKALADRSNFAIAIPFTNDDTFQGGINTSGSVQVELSGTRSATQNLNCGGFVPRAIYVEDVIVKYYALKPSSEPQISISRASVEQMFAGH